MILQTWLLCWLALLPDGYLTKVYGCAVAKPFATSDLGVSATVRINGFIIDAHSALARARRARLVA